MNKPKLLYHSFELVNLLKEAKVPVGGAAVEWNTWLTAFVKLGCKVGLLTYQGAKNLIKLKPNYEIIESYNINKGIPKLRLVTYRLPSYYKAIKKYNPDFIFQGCATENTGYFAFLSKLLKKPFIHRVGSDMDVDGRIENNFSKISMIIYYWGIKNANHISCQNKYQYGILKKKYPTKSISILYNPYFYKEKEIISKRERTSIAWIGNFRYEKNLPALAKVVANFPNIKFKIAGTRFKNTDLDTKEGLEELEKMQNVEFLGHVNNDEITELLAKAYFLLNTSRLEGFSNTFLEAWSVGTPIVTTANVNPDGIVSKHNVGLVADDYMSLKVKVEEMLNLDEEDYSALSSRCINYVKENHDPIKLAKEFLKEIENFK